MDFLLFSFIVFLNSPYRETPKNVLKKKSQEKNILGLVGSSGVNQTYVEVRQFIFECPSPDLGLGWHWHWAPALPPQWLSLGHHAPSTQDQINQMPVASSPNKQKQREGHGHGHCWLLAIGHWPLAINRTTSNIQCH
jgi:hypothetical protein